MASEVIRVRFLTEPDWLKLLSDRKLLKDVAQMVEGPQASIIIRLNWTFVTYAIRPRVLKHSE